jgi:uncharacterized membrane protein YphA (DoxX/SURF4 family)
MKTIVNIARVLVGSLFIFSGLVKAIDPLGLSYKMQEFFEVWGNSGFAPRMMAWFGNHTLLFSIVMITIEVVLGAALLLGWMKKITGWLLLALTLFFTFLTSYVLFSGKIRACGCFGDCIPLTPVQTFTKDIILLLLIILILFGQKYIQPLCKNIIATSIMAAILILVCLLQWWVLKHLPLIDCLPFKKGSNLLENRKMPKDAVMDKYEYTFIYQKGDEQKEFKATALPDSTWKFKDRTKKLISKGKNNIPLINDFTLSTANGSDTTEAVLSQTGNYYILFCKDFDNAEVLKKDFKKFYETLNGQKPVYVVTSLPAKAAEIFAGYNLTIFTCDYTAIKTAARADAVLYLMNGAVVENKWSSVDMGDAVKK